MRGHTLAEFSSMPTVTESAFFSMTATKIVGDWDEYLWMVVCGGLAAAFMAWGIGANDVANSFATSVGSKTLKLWQACIIAGIFEFTGAMLLGGSVAKTIASGIANTALYTDVPEIYMYGMLCSLTIAGLWLLVATMWCFAISTTHTIMGSIMGFALKGDFPYLSGFLLIVLSWFFSPIIGGILAAIFFNICRIFILRSDNSTNRAIWAIPLLVLFTLFINILFVLVKGAMADLQKRWPCKKATGYKGMAIKDCSDHFINSCWIAAAAAGGAALVSGLILIPLLKRKMRREAEAEELALENGDKAVEEDLDAPQAYEKIHVHEIPAGATWVTPPYHYVTYAATASYRQVIKGLTYDVHSGAANDAKGEEMIANAEVFAPQTERIFSYLQVLSASCVAFAHGSKDVANSIGPYSVIYYVFKNHKVPGSSAEAPKWIFALGGGMIVVGLATYGYNIIMIIGVKYLHLTPARGFSAELAAGMTIALASFFGIPVSTTQIIVGAETGIGLCESIHGVRWALLAKTFFGWILTIVLALGFCAGLFAAGAYAPSITMAADMREMNFGVYTLTSSIYKSINTTTHDYSTNLTWWEAAPSTWAAPFNARPYNGSMLAFNANKSSNSFKSAIGSDVTGKRGYVLPELVLYYLNDAVKLNATYSTTNIGI
ncbi:hypothetical protein FOA52_008943 [Chlamydomonas sp. UWO 241]|nr:hypothetical protein FOA52_008943 [Chlamydomonas sp. UWO 241]